jgi:hypothetical protein
VLLGQLGAAGAADVVPWHVQGQVVDGRTTTVRLTLRLPADAPVGRWAPADWEDLERQVRRRLAPGGGDPVVGIHLVRALGNG